MVPFAIVISASTAAIDCGTFAARAGQPVAVRIEQIAARSLDPHATVLKPDKPWLLSGFLIGKLLYQRNGYEYHSSDDGFPAIVDSVSRSPKGICGYEAIVPGGYDPASGTVVGKGNITFYRPDQPPEAPRGTTAVDQGGVRPVLDGYVARASVPIYRAGGQMLIGLMRSTAPDRPPTTAIVVFSPRAGRVSAMPIATIRGRYSSLSILPNLHGTGCGLALTGRGNDGSLRQVSLWMEGPTEDALAAQFATPTR